MLLVMTTTTAVQAAQFDLSVVDGDGNPVNGFRWILQEDHTYAVDPNVPAPIDQRLGGNFHASHHPLAQKQGAAAGQPLNGNTDGNTETVLNVPPGRYYLSVLPTRVTP